MLDATGRVLTIDTETTGLDKLHDKPFLIQFKVDDQPTVLSRDISPTIDYLNCQMPQARCVVFHNAKYDLHQLTNVGLSPENVYNSKIFCTQVTEAIIDEHRRDYHLDTLGRSYLGKGKSGEEELYQWLAEKFGGKPTRKVQIGRIQYAPAELVDKYAGGDVDLTYGIYLIQRDLLALRNLEAIQKLEMRVLVALYEIERRGVPVDIDQITGVREGFVKKIAEIEQEIEGYCGGPVNPRSGPQMKAAFEKLGIPLKMGDKGNPTFAAEVLEKIDHPFCKAVLSSRTYGMMISTFLNGFESHVYLDNRIRCDFNQTRGNQYGVRTGRLSASNPNLQQIPNPKRKNREIAEAVRSLFKAPDGYDWVSSDWEQFEFRIFGHYTGDPKLLSAFAADPKLDYHQVVADLTGLERNPFAKQLNLGLVFGMGEGKMAKTLKLPYQSRGGKLFAGKKAKAIFKQYHTKLPRVRKLLSAAEAKARRQGFITTILGRRLHFPAGKGAHKAGGLLFQGTAADLMKLKLVELNDYFRKTDIELILPVHDEFNLLAPAELSEDVADRVTEIMQDIPQLNIPILADAGRGSNWWEASK